MLFDEHDLGQYICCRTFWEFIHAPCPCGLGLTHVPRGRHADLLLDLGMADMDRVTMAEGLYALYRLVNHVRFRQGHNLDSQKHDKSQFLKQDS